MTDPWMSWKQRLLLRWMISLILLSRASSGANTTSAREWYYGINVDALAQVNRCGEAQMLLMPVLLSVKIYNVRGACQSGARAFQIHTVPINSIRIWLEGSPVTNQSSPEVLWYNVMKLMHHFLGCGEYFLPCGNVYPCMGWGAKRVNLGYQAM